MYLAGWPLSQGWIQLSLALYVLAGICWLPVIWLQIQVQRMAEEALRSGEPMAMKATTYMKIWFTLGWPAFLAFIVIFYLMVAKSF